MHTPEPGQEAVPEPGQAPASGTGQPTYRVPAPPPPQAAGAPAVQAPPRRRGWVVGVIVALVIIALLGCCILPFFALAFGGGMSSADVYSNGIAVIHVNGVIAGTTSSDPLFGGGEVTPEYLIDILHAADDDPGIEAIVLRIDSPGGTAAASQEIAMELARIEKPVIASVGDVAASGAYWIAAQCDVIVATPSSSVGSIGVILQIANYEELMEKIGVEYTTLTQGEFKDAGSPFRSLTTTEIAMLEEDMAFIYDEFISAVAEGRDLDEDDVRDMATGWVWNGVRSQEMGLIDEIGTINDALDIAADEAGIDSYEVIYYDEPTPWDILYWLLMASSDLGGLADAPLEGAGAPPVPR